MHVVIVTSMLRPVRDHTVFATSTRIEQTEHTIKTAREKIQGCYIVMVDGGFMTDQEKNLFGSLVDHLHHVDVTKLNKSPGEATILHTYLTSSHFQRLENVETVSKLSGRYYLNDNFNWDTLPMDKFIIAIIHVAWMGKPLYKTRYYRIPRDGIQYFIDGLKRYIDSWEFAVSWPDIEHCFHYHNIVKHDEVYCPDKLGVCGLITGSNELVED